MDHLRRLTFGFFLLAATLAMIAPRLARADGWEYTPKVAGTSGGVAKTQAAQVAGYYVMNGGWRTTLAALETALGNNLAGTQAICPATKVVTYASCAGGACYLMCSDGVGRFYANYTQPTGCASTNVAGPCPLLCPEGTVEGAGGLCYSPVCPTATPPWEADPGDSSRCRRPTECPYPQKFVVASGSCECDSGTAWAVPEGGGLATPVHGVGSVAWTSPDFTNKPTTGCMSENGTVGQSGCTFQVDAWGWNGTRMQIEGDTFTGAKCTVAAGNTTPDVTGCPAGQVAGTINGQTVCVEGGKTETTKPPKTETTVKTNADGSTDTTTTTTTEVTKCDGGNCTTTITTSSTTVHKDPQGNTTGTETTGGTTTQPGTGSGGNGNGDGDGVASSFGGACPSFSCEGDAVQCAIALEQHKRNCEVLGDVGGLTREAAVEAFDQARTFDDDQLTTEGTLAGVSSSTFLGGGCLADAVYTIKGETITIPFSSLCVYIQAAGLAFLAVCGLISFGIVSRGVTA